MYLIRAALLVIVLAAPSLAQSYGTKYYGSNSPNSGRNLQNSAPQGGGWLSQPQGLPPRQTDTRYDGLNYDGKGGNVRPGGGYY